MKKIPLLISLFILFSFRFLCADQALESDSKAATLSDNETAGIIVLIMDDMGFCYKPLMPIMKLGVPITFSILPFYPFSEKLAIEGKKAGNDIMLHMPMEAKVKNNRENGMLLSTMTRQNIVELLEKSIHAVPHITGVSNHKGSLFTENHSVMALTLEHIKEKNLFFFDSKTSNKSVGFTMAKELGIKTSQRDMFLDNEVCYDYIVKQIERLAEIAGITGCAIGIGHPYPETIKAITDMVPVLLKQNYKFAPLREVLE